MLHVTQIARERFNTIYLRKEKQNDTRDILQSRAYFSSPRLYTASLISSPFFRSKCCTISMHPCAAIESPSLPSSIISLSSSSSPASLFFLLFHRHRSHARIFFFHAGRPSVHRPRRLPVFLRATHTPTNEEPKPCTR